jgi:ABC-type multidrug transport system fused ATPase/permease subunit
MVLDVRRDLFEHLTSLSLRYFSEQRAGWIIARLTSDVDALSDVLNQGLTTLVVNTLTLVAAIGGLFLLDWRLGLVALLVLPPGILVTRWFQRTSHEAFSDVRTRIAAVTAQLAESVAGMAVVQAFTRERAFQREFETLNEANRVSNVYAQKLSSIFFPAIELLGVIAQVLVLYAGAQLIDGGSLEIGTLIAAAGLLSLVFQPLQELSELYGQVQAASAAMGKISTVLDAVHDVTDRPGARALGRIEGRVELEGVGFAYGDEPVIHGLELDVPAGGCIALVGESGGGKSTTAKLVARFYDPDAGAVRVDGVDLRDVRLQSYRRQLGVVLQDPFLFSGTIADNLRFARPEATDAEVAEAARAIGVDRVAARFEDGLDHVVREGGAGLSAGERQLISIARALVADPRILILDEATSNIDRPSEVLIERAFDTLLRGRTSLIIAHRLATVRRADEIVVLERGRIAQRGTYDELMAVEGSFRRLATTLEGADARRVA